MPMDNETISNKLAVVESQVSTLVLSSQRVEAMVERISFFDKTQAEMMQRHQALNERLIEVIKEVEKCSQAHQTETTRLWAEITSLNKLAHGASSIGKAANIFLIIAVGIGGYFFDFLFDTAQTNRASLIDQGRQLVQIERMIDRAIAAKPYN